MWRSWVCLLVLGGKWSDFQEETHGRNDEGCVKHNKDIERDYERKNERERKNNSVIDLVYYRNKALSLSVSLYLSLSLCVSLRLPLFLSLSLPFSLSKLLFNKLEIRCVRSYAYLSFNNLLQFIPLSLVIVSYFNFSFEIIWSKYFYF